MKLRALLLVGAIAVTACGGEADVAREPAPTSTPTTASQIQLPLTAYLATEDELELEQRAAFQAQVDCAARFGVVMEPFPVDKSSIRAQMNIARRYGLIDKDEVAIHGYGFPPSAQGDQMRAAATPEQSRIDEVISGQDSSGKPSSMKDDKGEGIPEGGCGAEGFRLVRGDVDHDYDSLPKQLLEQARQLMLADADYVEVEKDWAACMERSGYDFEHPYEAGNSVGDADNETQRRMAMRDVDCALEVNLPGRAMAIDAGYQLSLIQENEAQLRSALEAKREIMDNVKSVLN